jgi:hypothetical protein
VIKGLGKAFKAIDAMVTGSNETIKKEYIKTLTKIIQQTPVHFKDGGRLRNSWNLSESSPKGVARTPNGNGIGSVASVARMPKTVIGKRLFFTNPMPYANKVEYGGYPNPVEMGTNTSESDSPQFQKLSAGGYSKQAPSGMVRLNVKRMRTRLKRANK